MLPYTRKPRVVTIDIETLPALEPDCDVNAAKGAFKMRDAHAKTALSGDSGRLLCIGYADERGPGDVHYGVLGWDARQERFTCNEHQMLTDFRAMLSDFNPRVDRVVGHNLFDFDLKFIYKRSIVHGVPPAVELSFARYRSQPIFDTMCEWERWSFGGRISLDRLARVLSLQSSKTEGLDGSRVYEFFEAGRRREIHDYCLRDVKLTREIYRRMVFADAYSGADCAGELARMIA